MYKMPAFIDSHCHFLGMGYSHTLVQLQDVSSIQELQKKMRHSTQKKILIGRGWNQENFIDKRMPSIKDLDAISKEVPIVITRACGHVVVINSKMLSILSLNGKKLDSLSKTDQGLFVEQDIHLVYEKIPKPTKADLKHYLKIANRICLSNGVTKVASDDFCVFDIPYEEVMTAIHESIEEGLIQVSITEQVHLPSKELLLDFIQKGYPNKSYPKFKMGPLKLLADGSLGGRTAALNHAYSDEPANQGILNFSDSELTYLIRLADEAGMDSAIHVIGDRATDQVLSSLKKVISSSKRKVHNHALIHAQMVNFNQIEIMKDYHIGAIIQPIFLNSDLSMIKDRLGNRIKETYLFHSMKLEGIEIGFSTDCPVENLNPFENIFVSMKRTSLSFPKLPAHLTSESFSLDEALSCYTLGNLRYIYELNCLDYIFVDKHPNSVNVEMIPSIKVMKTVIEGVVVYNRN